MISTSQYFLIPGMVKPPSAQLIIDECAKAFNVESRLVKTKLRNRPIKYARWFVWKILRSHRYRNIDCVRATGAESYTTITNAMGKIDSDIAQYPDLFMAWDKVKHLMGEFEHKGVKYYKPSKRAA